MTDIAIQTSGCLPLSQWLDLAAKPSAGLRRALAAAYGNNAALLGEKAGLLRRVLDRFGAEFGGAREVFVVRSTGRVNLMGMHVDHRGGFVNPIAISEDFFVVGPRDDDVVHLVNVDSLHYPRSAFRISEELPQGPIADWDAWTMAEYRRRVKAGTAGDWANYAKAAVLYLQHRHTTRNGAFAPALRGMDVAVLGNVPAAAGLSSSSALVVGIAEACVYLNHLRLDPMDLVGACAQGEWYVGTRGGAGDHAAIKFGRRGHLSHLGNNPLQAEALPMPPGYVVVLANSLVEAKKMTGARDVFNQRVACYEFGLHLLRRAFPAHAERMVHLRDVNPETLSVPAQDIYRMVRALPQLAGRDEIAAALDGETDFVERTFASHADPADGYRIRQVVMYGIGECRRSSMVSACLERGDLAGFGKMMYLSHDGDRVTRLVNGRRVRVDNRLTDAHLDALIADLDSSDPRRREWAALWRRPGGYDVSTPELDTIVDLVRPLPGVVGAQRVGAGLGGTVVVLVAAEQEPAVTDALAKGYCEPRGLPVECRTVIPVGGSGVINLRQP